MRILILILALSATGCGPTRSKPSPIPKDFRGSILVRPGSCRMIPNTPNFTCKNPIFQPSTTSVQELKR